MAGRLAGWVCLVTGATRGVGKGVAVQLGEAGAKVYVTGRTLRAGSHPVGGSLEETADEITRRGGEAIPVQCDHSKDEEVRRLFQRVASEQDGQLDVLVNNAFSAVTLLHQNFGVPFWKQPDSMWDEVNNVGLRNEYLCTVQAARLMVARSRGLIINISSLGGLVPVLNVPYCVGKTALDRFARDGSLELRDHGVVFLSLWPSSVRTETILSSLERKVFRDEKIRALIASAMKMSETPEFVGKCIVTLACDPTLMRKSGRVLLTGDLADEYKLLDVNGERVRNWRSLKTVLELSDRQLLSRVMPRWVKLPKWLMYLMANKFARPLKTL